MKRVLLLLALLPVVVGSCIRPETQAPEGNEVSTPHDSIEINMVMKAVWGIKAKSDPGVNEDLLAIVGQHLADRGAELIVLGCTEIPLAYNPARVDLPVVNATLVLAQRAVDMYQRIK